MRILSHTDIDALADMPDLIAVIRAAMQRVSEGAAELPLRSVVELGGGNRFGIMPGVLSDPPSYGAKLLSLFPENPRHGRSSHAGVMLLFDPATGLPVACLDASILTAQRTAAASAVATAALARTDARVLALIGCGEQAGAHLPAMRAVRPIERVLVWGRDPARAEAFAVAHPGVQRAPSVADAVAAADIVCTVTSAATPVLFGAMLRPGQHLNAVGASIPTMQEIAPDCLPRAAVFTDYLPSWQAQAGEARAARAQGLVPPDFAATEIGDVLRGVRLGRRDEREITLYRSLGIAAQDLAAARYLFERAVATGRGIVAEMFGTP
jgi:alanine dehydrogenase